MKLFIDDERHPAFSDPELMIARSFKEAVDLVMEFGFPDVVYFDHDLGEGKTGYDFAKWLVDYDIDTGLMPDNFSFEVHSQNPIGSKNIETYIDGYLSTK